MNLWTEKLIGTWVDGVDIGVCFLTLHLRNAESEFKLSSNADISLSCDARMSDFRESAESANIGLLVRKRVQDLQIASDVRSGELTFDNGMTLRAYWTREPVDNLFLVSEVGTENWGVIG